jgi:uncharacterized membrane protein
MTTSQTQNIFRIILGAFMLFAGISHLTFNRIEFQAQVPNWLPFSKDFVVIASGFVEIAFGLVMIWGGKYKTKVGLALAVFYVLIFPGNISQYINGVDAFGALNSDRARLIRLFFQPVLIAWALWSTGAWQEWRQKI